MKHAAIFTRLAQRVDPNIPILEAAMDEIAQLEEQLETSGYSPITEEVEDILRSKNQNLFNALMESTKRTDEQAAEISRLKALVGKCEEAILAIRKAEEMDSGLLRLSGYNRCSEALAAIKEEGL